MVNIVWIPSQQDVKKEDSPFQTVFPVSTIPFQRFTKNSFTAFQAMIVADLIASHTAITASRNQSHLFHSSTIIAITAAIANGIQPMAATTAPSAGTTVPDTNAMTPEIAAAICGTTVIMVPMAPTTLPIIIRTGPTAAATNAIVTISFFVPSSNPFSQSTNP